MDQNTVRQIDLKTERPKDTWTEIQLDKLTERPKDKLTEIQRNIEEKNPFYATKLKIVFENNFTKLI